MLQVFFTVDVEVWCGGWDDIDKKFGDAFKKYVYGPTRRGNFGLSYQVEVLKDHGLIGTFFVEPLFSSRFGREPLETIVQEIQKGAHEIQLHLHTEWVDESASPLLPTSGPKRQFLRQFSLDEQRRLLIAARDLLCNAGASEINAFRAGGFGFNRDTLRALSDIGIDFDSSYNAAILGNGSGVVPRLDPAEPFECEGVFEYPMTVYQDGTPFWRHAQLTARTFGELEALLWQALEQGRSSFVILSHNFELLNRSKTQPDPIVVRRFLRLCRFFDRNRDAFVLRGFRGLVPKIPLHKPSTLTLPIWRTAFRMAEQALRYVSR